MKERCYYEKHEHYADYGGRGIRVCERWQTFPPFYEDNLPFWQAGLTLDRIDNDGDYEPGNTRWTTRTVQARNKRNTLFITLGNETKTLMEWSETTGVPDNVLRMRLSYGWSAERMLTTPVLQRRRP